MSLNLDEIARKIELIRQGRDFRQIYRGARTWNSQRASVLIALLELDTINAQEIQVLLGSAGGGNPGWIGQKGRQRATNVLAQLAVRGEVESQGFGLYKVTDLGKKHGEQCRQAKLAAARMKFDEIRGMIDVGADRNGGEE